MLELILGIFGLLLILAAFMLDEFETKINQGTITYNCINILGSGLLVWYAHLIKSWPFLVLNGFWMMTAMYKLTRIMAGKSKKTACSKPKKLAK